MRGLALALAIFVAAACLVLADEEDANADSAQPDEEEGSGQAAEEEVFFPSDDDGGLRSGGAAVPSSSAGCVPIQQCPALMELIQTNRSRVEALRCGSSGGEFTYKCIQGKDPSRISFNAKTPDDAKCGVSTTGRIFGGVQAEAHEFPWMAGLVYVHPQNKASRLTLCGGSLISPRFILTAAHCLSATDGHLLSKVRMGHADLTSKEAYDIDIVEIQVNPNLETYPYHIHDLALLKINQSQVPASALSDFIPICLPEADNKVSKKDDIDLDSVVVAGWGLVNSKDATTVLQKLSLNLTDGVSCENDYKRTRFSSFSYDESFVCAKGVSGTDSCKGDSGGPLMVVPKGHQHYVIVGVTSFGAIKCDSSLPGIYANVSSHLEWINGIIYD